MPAEKGDARNLTNTVGAHERSPAWSPDGKRVAYFSDAVRASTSCTSRRRTARATSRSHRARRRRLLRAPAVVARQPKIAYTDNSQSLFVLDVETRRDREGRGRTRVYGPRSTIAYGWSPDSRWLAYTVEHQAAGDDALRLLARRTTSRSPITDGLSEVSEPVFDRSGKYLYVLASTDAGPVLDWFAQSNADNCRTRHRSTSIVLRNDLPNPLARESDEEKADAPRDSGASGRNAKPAGGTPAAAGSTRPAAVTIDFDGIDNRIVALPIASRRSVEPAGGRRRPDLLPARVRADAVTAVQAAAARAAAPLRPRQAEGRRQFSTRRATTTSSADGKKLLYAHRDTWSIVADGDAKPTPGQAGWPPSSSRCGSIRAPSGRRSSTRRGASTATTSTPPTCTASTGRR